MKRAVDILLSALAMPVVAIVTLIAGAAIRLESEGPALFRQTRVGRDGRSFTCLKLRTMYLDTPQAASHEVTRSSVTRVGAFMRRTKLDELPQLWNVLVGDMSIVGPRPCLPTQLELVELRRRLGVLSVRPGITGLAQVNDIDMSDPAKLARVDAEYVRDVSLGRDFRLMFLTFAGKGQGDKVGA